MADKDELKKITITRSVVFDKAICEAGAVVDVTDDNRAAARNLIRSGKAVEGEIKKPAGSPNKQVGSTDLDKK
jgi:chromosome condensin MukBEF MukE localization factor